MLKKVLKTLLNYYRRILSSIRHNNIGEGTELCKGALMINCDIGRYCYLGMYSYFNHVKMGNYCSIAGNVTIGAMEHDYSDFSTSTHLSERGYDNRVTELGNDVWIGAQCVIRQGVKIGDGAVIGANSFVNKDIPPFAIAFGTPAKVYKMRFDPETIDKILQSKYWNSTPKKARELFSSF